MNIAVITGASSGLGAEYTKALADSGREIDEIWLIARRYERLKELSSNISKKTKILCLDLTDENDIEKYENELRTNNPNVKILINNAGFGKLGKVENIDNEYNRGMIRLNCEALTVLTNITLKYMKERSEIINTCSIAAFAPNPNLTVYSATKAYVFSFSKALREELKQRKINVLAVCPGPMDTEFLSVANITPGASHTFDTLPRVKPKDVAVKSLKASLKGRAVYTNRLFYKFYRVVSKILPHNFVMKVSKA